MLCTVEYIEIVQNVASEGTFGEHALNGVADDSVSTVLALAQLGGSVEALTARITSITCVNLVSLFLACEYHFSGIDDDYVVTAVYVGSEIGFVLSTEELGNLRAKTTDNLVCGIDNDPLFLYSFLVSGNSLVT